MSIVSILVNWNQGNSDMIQAHQIMDVQSGTCQIGDMKGKCDVFGSIQEAEATMKQRGVKKYKHCSHCWDGIVVDLN
jgi:hypothetical protein